MERLVEGEFGDASFNHFRFDHSRNLQIVGGKSGRSREPQPVAIRRNDTTKKNLHVVV